MNRKWYINEYGIKVKPCATCEETLPETSFRKMNKLGKLSAYCLDCEKSYHKKYRWEHRKTDRVFLVHKVFEKDGLPYKKCNKCEHEYPHTTEFFDRQAHGQNGLKSVCKNCNRETVKDNKKKSWEKVLVRNAKTSAKERNLEFDISEEFVKSLYKNQGGRCYWFGVEMIPSRQSKTLLQPSIDRINRHEGYTRDNVVLCTFAANFGRNENSEKEWKRFLITIQNSDYSQWQ